MFDAIVTTVLFDYSITGLRCHDCTGAFCDRLIQWEWKRSGKCVANEGGKCFVRQDPNGSKLSWGLKTFQNTWKTRECTLE